MSKYLVDLPGLGIHNRFHLKFDEHTCLDLVMGPFDDRVLNLRCPSKIPYGLETLALFSVSHYF